MERLGYWRDRRGEMEEAEEEGKGEWTMEELIRKEKKMQREERWERIRNSRYNEWYKWVKKEGVPGYLKKGWGESRWQRVAKFRLGSEVREEDTGRM